MTLDPKNPLTVWVGSGENNSQRAVQYGDGVYKSLDGGTTWKNMGLKTSEHISTIAIDPRDSNVVWVAAQGPLWKDGGERGLYVTRDGGKTWTKAFETSPHTGVTEVLLDPRNPDVMFATTYQRRRAVWTLIDGGPESGMRKSTDGGKTWRKITNGLPKVDMGRIGMAISPAKPDTMYAIIEAAGKESGMYRSVDGGENWEKRSDYVSTSPQAYNEIVADPNVADRVYSMDTWMHVSDDGAKTMRKVGEKHKHVDNHALWIDPADSDHLLAGCDGGVYESWDRGGTWKWSENLPLSQFYKVGLDNATPFYNIYGGTQDNNSIGGPSRNRSANGIVNSDWFIMVEGDGFQPVVDPTDPNIVYAESQHAGIVRFDKRTGETVDIQPQADANDPPLRWNWDSPLIISPHQHTRLYFAAQRLFRSDDRGNTWTPVSPDLTRQINRNELPLMGRVWGPDTVAKNASTSFYGNIVALSESTKKEGLLAIGTDDGLIQISEDGGKALAQDRKIPRRAGSHVCIARAVLAARHEHAVRVVRQPQDRRLQAVRSEEHRPRQDLDLDHRRPAGARQRVCGRRGSGEAGPAVRRHRVRRVLHARRRQALDPAQGRHADDPGARPGDPETRERPRCRDVRARLLCARRLLAAARDQRRGTGEGRRAVSGQAGVHVRADVAVRRHRCRLQRRPVLHRAESAARRRVHVLPQGRTEDAREDAPGCGEGTAEEERGLALSVVGRTQA